MRIISFFLLIIWILIFPVIAGVVSYTTEEKSYYYLALISILCIFNLIWFVLNMNNPKIDLITTVGNLLVLNICAYFSIKKYYQEAKLKKENKNKSDTRYVFLKTTNQNLHPKSPQIEDFDFDFTDDELQQLENKASKKNNKVLTKAINNQIEANRKITWGFCVYLLLLIYQENPSITSTYQILENYKNKVDDSEKLTQNIASFSSRKDLDLFIPDYDRTIDSWPVLNLVPSEEFKVALKQDRVDMQIKAKLILESSVKKKA